MLLITIFRKGHMLRVCRLRGDVSQILRTEQAAAAHERMNPLAVSVAVAESGILQLVTDVKKNENAFK